MICHFHLKSNYSLLCSNPLLKVIGPNNKLSETFHTLFTGKTVNTDKLKCQVWILILSNDN